MAIQQQGEGLDGLAEPHIVSQHAAKARLSQGAQPPVTGLLIGAQGRPQRRGRLGEGLEGQGAQAGSQIQQRLSSLEGNAAARQRLGDIGQSPAFAQMKPIEQAARGQKNPHQRDQLLGIQRHESAVSQTLVQDHVFEQGVQIEVCGNGAVLVNRQGLDDRDDDLGQIKGLSPRLEGQTQREPVRAPGAAARARADRDRPFVQPPRPIRRDLHTPARRAQVGDVVVHEGEEIGGREDGMGAPHAGRRLLIRHEGRVRQHEIADLRALDLLDVPNRGERRRAGGAQTFDGGAFGGVIPAQKDGPSAFFEAMVALGLEGQDMALVIEGQAQPRACHGLRALAGTIIIAASAHQRIV